MARVKRQQLAELRAAERTVEELEEQRHLMRARGRSALGVGGDQPADTTLDPHFPLAAISILAAVASIQVWAMVLAAPMVAETLGAGPAVAIALGALTPVIMALVAPVIAATVPEHHRATAVVLAGLLSAGALLLAALAPTVLALALVLVVGAVAASVGPALHPPLLFDLYPPPVRPRAIVRWRVGEGAGMAVAVAAVAGLTTALDVTWRSAFLVLSALAAAAAVVAYGLRGPVPGRDIDGVRAAVTDGTAPTGPVESAPLGAFESMRRVLLVPTVRPLLVAYAALGLCGVPTVTYLLYFADERWHLGLGGRGLLLVGITAIAIATLVRAAPAAGRRFAASPAAVLRAAMLELGVAAAALVAGANAPFLVVAMALITIGLVSLALVRPSLDVALLSLFPPPLRAHASGLAAASMWTAGGLGGIAVLSGMDRRFGPGGALVVAALAGAQGALALRAASRTVDEDVDRLVDEIVDEVELQQLVAGGRHLPLLACRHVDFSYGQLQVLFDVDFTVDDGEMVALLGTNGAGKSTLLRVVSGLSLPSRGTVRLAGIDVTYVDAERRTRLGVSQVPGGRGVYGPLSVLENLRVLGYSRGRDQAAVNRGIEEAFEAFPRLAERRNQPASTLSGGEQQMLSLSRAFLVHPRLLLIDELSLGLAPKVVSELLTMVRRINAEGTAVVIVEQSVNVALSLVDHAYFMEKGEVRFDGVASELLARPDLLRSVFLQGAASNGEARST